MVIREALKTDIPEIVSVLKKSLGEADLPLSEEIWNYKHRENPFGASIVLVAEEEGKIAGVRAFMRWNWQTSNKIYSSLRAVDTVTHPDFQGRGIFKKLTLKAVDIAQNSNDHFIFNTPNEKSRPGYIKMGWKSIGKLKVGLKPAWSSFYMLKKEQADYVIKKKASSVEIEALCEEWNKMLREDKTTFTPKSLNYLTWRYEENPLQQYEVISTSEIYIACYVKKRRNIKELRISECIFRNNSSNRKEIMSLLKLMTKKFGVQVISYSADLLKTGLINYEGNIGPIFTLRNLNLLSEELEDKENIAHWKYSLGDLELF